MNKKLNNKILLFGILLLTITMGYAAISSTLNITGTSRINNPSWDVHWNNVVVSSGSVTGSQVTTAAHILTGNTEVEYSITLSSPGEYYEFTVDAVNAGTIDAMIGTFSNKVYESDGTTERNLPDYLAYTVSYNDGSALATNHLLGANSTEKYKVRVEYKTDIDPEDLPTATDTLVYKFDVNYIQANDNAIALGREVDFTTDSWSDIATAYSRGKTVNLQQAMEAGTTRSIELDLDNDGTSETTADVRIVNLSSPSECATTGFSGTACGFVLEIADIITTNRMNPYSSGGSVNGDGNKGGWEHSEMRSYLNSTVFNALPSALRSKVINTKVISGHGGGDSDNFDTTDKLYLLSTHEVFSDVDGNTNSGIDRYDSAYNNTRQLDYYALQSVTTSSYSGAIKQNLGGTNSEWWLRSAYGSGNNYFYTVAYNGSFSYTSSRNSSGVSPAFRIG